MNKIFKNPTSRVCFKVLRSKYYAKCHYIMTPTIIDNIISNKSSNTLEPMVGILCVFSKQPCSIQGLEYQDDPTVQLLYSIVQNALSNEIRKEHKTVDVLVNDYQKRKSSSNTSTMPWKVPMTLSSKWIEVILVLDMSTVMRAFENIHKILLIVSLQCLNLYHCRMVLWVKSENWCLSSHHFHHRKR
ncbi:hypothetical protein BDB00DRAFT_368076 [Zychaea mexicana]|uniref:uncharacterized protein n=1 Tax=Zychaea mexicana TaxID=64656 RepID=UPI0022FE8C6E|nr:uncharacterized protein BDB00DRAFT_368076 [Zychaea mexicana]KAI9493586.1 hypothetical protein BDB00DRAFT_368076 [Zychaea mexicana]